MKQNSKAAQRIREQKKATIAARMPQIEQEEPSRSFLSAATKAKIGAAALAITTVFTGLSVTSCDNSTSPTTIPDENLIGHVGSGNPRIEVRVDGVNAADRAMIVEAFNTFRGNDNGATSLAELESWGVDINNIFHKVVITGIASPGTTESNVNGILRGKITLAGFIAEGYFASPTSMMYDSRTNIIGYAQRQTPASGVSHFDLMSGT